MLFRITAGDSPFVKAAVNHLEYVTFRTRIILLQAAQVLHGLYIAAFFMINVGEQYKSACKPVLVRSSGFDEIIERLFGSNIVAGIIIIIGKVVGRLCAIFISGVASQ